MEFGHPMLMLAKRKKARKRKGKKGKNGPLMATTGDGKWEIVRGKRRFSQAIQPNRTNDIKWRAGFRGVLNLVNSADNIQKTQVSGLADGRRCGANAAFWVYLRSPSWYASGDYSIGGANLAWDCGCKSGSKTCKAVRWLSTTRSGSTIVLKQGRLIEVDCDDFVLNCKTYPEVNATTGANFDTPKLETTQVLTAQGKIMATVVWRCKVAAGQPLTVM